MTQNNSLGFFTSFLTKDGNVLYLDDHLDRLEQFASHYNISLNITKLKKKINEIVSPTEGVGKGKVICTVASGEIDVEWSPFKANHAPINLTVREISKPLGNIKHWPFWNGTIKEGHEEILVDSEGIVLEGSYTNVFLKIDKTLYTHPVDGKILDGIGRKRFISLMTMMGYTIEEDYFSSELLKHGEIFLTNSVRGVVKGILS